MRKRIKNLILTVLIFAACITAVGFVPRDTGYDYTVGIVQLVRHSALGAATQGFTDALEAAMEEAGKTVKIDYQDAQNETVNCSIIANNFVAKKYDLIMANATAALQACYNATEEIPILGTSVTVYDVALGLKNASCGAGGHDRRACPRRAPRGAAILFIGGKFPLSGGGGRPLPGRNGGGI